jgi:hypothetical protein
LGRIIEAGFSYSGPNLHEPVQTPFRLKSRSGLFHDMSALVDEVSRNSRAPMFLNNRACLVFSALEHFLAQQHFKLLAIKLQTEQLVILFPINKDALLS